MSTKWLSAEELDTMVGADFGTAETARSAARAVRAEPGLKSSALRIIRPDDPEIDRKLEPESHGIAGTMVRAHLVLGFIGLMSGLVMSLVLVGFGVQPLAASPVASISVITAFSAVAGLLAGGLFTLRPDHAPIIHRAKSAVRAGHWFVVVHARKAEQRRRAEYILSRFSDDTLRTA